MSTSGSEMNAKNDLRKRLMEADRFFYASNMGCDQNGLDKIHDTLLEERKLLVGKVEPEVLTKMLQAYEGKNPEDIADSLVLQYGTPEARAKTAKAALVANIKTVARAFRDQVRSAPAHDSQALDKVLQTLLAHFATAKDTEVASTVFQDLEKQYDSSAGRLDQQGIDTRVNALMEDYHNLAEPEQQEAEEETKVDNPRVRAETTGSKAWTGVRTSTSPQSVSARSSQQIEEKGPEAKQTPPNPEQEQKEDEIEELVESAEDEVEPEPKPNDSPIDKLSKQLDAYETALKVRRSKNSSAPLNKRIEDLQKVKILLRNAKSNPEDADNILGQAEAKINKITGQSGLKNLTQNIRAKFSSKKVADSRSLRNAFKVAREEIKSRSAKVNAPLAAFGDLKLKAQRLRNSQPEVQPEKVTRPGSKGG